MVDKFHTLFAINNELLDHTFSLVREVESNEKK